MKITNKNHFPEALVKAVENDTYNRGDSDYSVTQLLKPPRMVALEHQLTGELTDDVEDRLWSLYGQCVHTILERANLTDLVEKRFKVSLDTPFGKKTVSGQIDSLSLDNTGRLTDWKFTTSWKFMQNKPPDPDYVSQLNMQKYVIENDPEHHGKYKVKSARIVGLLRDWSKLEARRSPDSYPQKQVIPMPIPLWDDALTKAFMVERICLMEKAKIELPECSPEERWAKQDIWAVMKGDRAIRMGLCFDEKRAGEMQRANPGTRIEFRPGQSPRCEAYCSVSDFCTQFKASKGVKSEVCY